MTEADGFFRTEVCKINFEIKRRTIENVIKSRWKCNFPQTLKSLHLSVRQWKKLFKFLSTDNKWTESDRVDFLHFCTQIVNHLYAH